MIEAVPDKSLQDHIKVMLDLRSDLLEARRKKELRHAEQTTANRDDSRFKELTDLLPQTVFEIDRNGRLTFTNRCAFDSFGYSEHDFEIGLFASDLIAAEDRTRFRENLQRVFNDEKLPGIEYYGQRKNGTIFPILVYINPSHLDGEIVGARGILVDITERKHAEHEIRKMAYHDALTGLPNRTLLKDRLDHALAQAYRDGSVVALMFIDLDRFKVINDTYGHSVGDEFLKAIARILRSTVRETDTVARLGGDEFILLLEAGKSRHDVTVVARKILEKLSAPFVIEGHQLFATVSIGVALYPYDARDGDSLMKHADLAMYAAKERGRNTYQFFSEKMGEEARERQLLEVGLRRALDRDEFFPVFQPQIDLKTRRIIGTEVLLRWRDPVEGMIPPSRFFPIAEETNLIRPIGEWVLKRACAQNYAWQQAGYPPLPVAVKLSQHHFKRPDFVAMLDQLLAETGLDPHLLELELAENVLMENAGVILETLTDLKVRGVQLTIDAFGAGYTPLSYLKHFPVDRVKISPQLMQNVPDNEEKVTRLLAILHESQQLGIDVVASGVESETQVLFLQKHNCLKMQGYFFCRPLSVDDMGSRLGAGLEWREEIPKARGELIRIHSRFENRHP